MEDAKLWELFYKDWYYKKTKQTIAKKDGDFCDVARIQTFEGKPNYENYLRITYFANKDDAKKKLQSIKGSGSGKIYTIRSDELNYLSAGYADIKTLTNDEGEIHYEIVPPSFMQAALVVGNCLYEHNDLDVYSREVYKDLQNQFVKKQAKTLYNDVVAQGEQKTQSEFGFSVHRSEADTLFKDTEFKNFCGGSVRVSEFTEGAEDDSLKTPNNGQSGQTNPSEAKSPKQDFITAINVYFEDTEISLSPVNVTPLSLEPSISTDAKGDRWDFLPGFIPYESVWKENVMITGGTIHVLLPEKIEKIKLNKNEGVPSGSVISATEPTRLLMNNGNKQALIVARPNKDSQVVLKAPKDQNERLFLEDGEVEIVVEPELGLIFGVETPNGLATVVHTHFLVRYDKKDNQTTVAVYEGKVEFKTKDGKTVSISPNGDKPGVVVVSQKLSPIKLVIVGLVLIAIVGGAVLFLKRKFASKIIGKKKR